MLIQLIARWPGMLILTLMLSVGGAFAAPPDGYHFLSLTDASRQASATGKPLLLYFGRYGCSTCRKMHAEVFTDPVLRQQYNDDFVLAYVDTESGNRISLANGERTTEMQFAARNRIIGTPTFVFFSPQQQPLFSKAGFQSIEQMKRYGDFIVEGHYKTMPLAEYLASQ